MIGKNPQDEDGWDGGDGGGVRRGGLEVCVQGVGTSERGGPQGVLIVYASGRPRSEEREMQQIPLADRHSLSDHSNAPKTLSPSIVTYAIPSGPYGLVARSRMPGTG